MDSGEGGMIHQSVRMQAEVKKNKGGAGGGSLKKSVKMHASGNENANYQDAERSLSITPTKPLRNVNNPISRDFHFLSQKSHRVGNRITKCKCISYILGKL